MSEDNYRVGRGRPPIHWRFKKGQPSPNPGGRPKKNPAIDIMSILDEPITVVQNGKAMTKAPTELSLRTHLKKALKDRNVKSMILLLDRFDKYGALPKTAVRKPLGGVLRMPNTMPLPMAMIIGVQFGIPPWTREQIAVGRSAYVATRTPDQARYDDAVGWPDL